MAQKELSHAYTQVSSDPLIVVFGDRGELYCSLSIFAFFLSCGWDFWVDDTVGVDTMHWLLSVMISVSGLVEHRHVDWLCIVNAYKLHPGCCAVCRSGPTRARDSTTGSRNEEMTISDYYLATPYLSVHIPFHTPVSLLTQPLRS
jgi:hypothetical protein